MNHYPISSLFGSLQELDKKPIFVEKFEQEAVEAHNRYHAFHGAPKMTLNRELCDLAQKMGRSPC